MSDELRVADRQPGTGIVRAVETAIVAFNFIPDLVVRGGRGVHDRSEFVLVRVQTSTGAVGYGEVSCTPLWSGEDARSATHFIRHQIAPVVLGEPLVPISRLANRMDRSLAGNPFTKAGVEMALWDALGRSLGMRVAELLGGPHRTEVPTKFPLSGDGEKLARTYDVAHAAGFRAFKVKVGLGVESDLARVSEARTLVGRDTFLGVDANGAYSRGDALRAIRALKAYEIAFIEQPLASSDLDGMRGLRSLSVPVMADEAVFSLGDMTQVIRAQAADAVSVYVGKSGGLGRAARQISVATAFGLDVVVGSNGEMGVGAAAQIHLACAAERLGPYPSDIIGQHFYGQDVLASPLPNNGRMASLPLGPGLGIELDPSIERNFT